MLSYKIKNILNLCTHILHNVLLLLLLLFITLTVSEGPMLPSPRFSCYHHVIMIL